MLLFQNEKKTWIQACQLELCTIAEQIVQDNCYTQKYPAFLLGIASTRIIHSGMPSVRNTDSYQMLGKLNKTCAKEEHS